MKVGRRMPARIERTYPHKTYLTNYVKTSKQIGNIRSDMIESYETPAVIKEQGAKPVPTGEKPVLTSKEVSTYYTDRFTGERAGRNGKMSSYCYNYDGSPDYAKIDRIKNSYEQTLVKNGSGKWYNERVNIPALDIMEAPDGTVKRTLLNSSYLDKGSIDELPSRIKKVVYAGFDDIIAKLTKLR